MAFYSGKNGEVTFNSNTIHVKDWTGTLTGEVLDTTNTGSSGWQVNITGIKSAKFTIKADFTGTNPMNPGDDAAISLVLGDSSKTISGNCRCASVAYENPVKGTVNFTAELESDGVISGPA